MILNITIFILSLALLITLYKFIKGETLPDKVVAFDILGIMSVALLVLLSIHFQRELYLDIALVFGLISFLGSTIFGRYIEKGI